MPKLGMETIRRRQVIDAVLRILGESGWRELTIREVADVAGVSSGIIAHYFGNKEQMTIDAISEAHRRLEQNLAEAEQGHADPLQRLIAFVDVLMASGRGEQPGWAFWLAIWGRVPFDRALQSQATALQRTFREAVSTAVAQGTAQKLFQAKRSAHDIADSLVALSQGLGIQHVLDPRAMTHKRSKAMLLDSLSRDLGIAFGAREMPRSEPARKQGAGA